VTGFGGILGQEPAVSALRRNLEGGRVASSYIFVGPPGVGRKSCALAYAAALNCTAESPEPCGECRSCRDMDRGVHPDVRIWRREKTVIHIDLVRELIASLQLKSYREGYRFAILDEADTMNEQSANALLMTLEEPPPGSIVILIAANPQLIPATILSRCQRISFRPLTAETVTDLLMAREEVDRERASAAAAMAGGSLTRAEEFLDDEWQHDWSEGLALIGMIPEAGEDIVLRPPVSDLKGSNVREKAQRLLTVWETVIRSALREKASMPVPGGEDLRRTASRLASALDEEAFIRVMEAHGRAAGMIRGNVNPRLVVEGFLLEISRSAARSVAPDMEGA
jgi:DNA polymerase-3 subunit delta'